MEKIKLSKEEISAIDFLIAYGDKNKSTGVEVAWREVAKQVTREITREIVREVVRTAMGRNTAINFADPAQANQLFTDLSKELGKEPSLEELKAFRKKIDDR